MRPIGPLTLATQPTTGPTIPLDIYSSTPQQAELMVEEAAVGTLVYVAEYTMQNVFNAAITPNWETLGAGVLVGTFRKFTMPAGVVVTAVRVRTTAGAGSITYYFTQGGLQ